MRVYYAEIRATLGREIIIDEDVAKTEAERYKAALVAMTKNLQDGEMPLVEITTLERRGEYKNTPRPGDAVNPMKG